MACTGCADACDECVEPMGMALSTLTMLEAAENA